MKIAAIILNYNDYEGTVSALKRIDGFSCIDHIAAVDNASTDDSAEKIGQAIEEFGLRAVLVRNPVNGGYGYGNNRGVSYVTDHFGAELALIANPDAHFSEEIVLRMAEIFYAETDAGTVGAVMQSKEPASEDSAEYSEEAVQSSRKTKRLPGSKEHTAVFSYEELTGSGWKRRNTAEGVMNGGPVMRRLFRHRLNYPMEYYRSRDDKDYVEVYAVHGSFLMVRTEEFLKVGGYDEAMFLYGEENVLAEKMYRAGLKTFLLMSGYMHEGSVSITGSGMNAVRRQRIRNESELFYYRRYLNAGRGPLFFVKCFQKAVILETAAAAFFRLI